MSATLDSIDPAVVLLRSRTWARELIDELRPHHDRGRLMEVAFRLPVYVVADLLGAPHAQLAQIARWMSDFVRCLAPTSSAKQIERGKLAAGELRDAVQALLVAQRPGSSSSLLATFADAARRAGCDGDDVIVANAIGFLSQAYEATAGLIGNTLVALAAQPDLRARVLNDLGLLDHILPEVLRYDPPIQNTRRFLGQDSVVAGQAIRAGEAVLVVLAAANRDPAANPHPQDFELFRDDRRSFTFGAGAHACPGGALAITIAHAGVAQLIAAGLDLAPLAETATNRTSANARIPIWHSKGEHHDRRDL